MKTSSEQISHVLFSKESYHYLYDLSKLTYAGLFLVSILQKQYGYAIIGFGIFIIFFIAGKYVEVLCLKR